MINDTIMKDFDAYIENYINERIETFKSFKSLRNKHHEHINDAFRILVTDWYLFLQKYENMKCENKLMYYKMYILDWQYERL